MYLKSLSRENFIQTCLEIVHGTLGFVDIVETRHLNDPANVWRVDLEVECPGGEVVPLLRRSTVNGETRLGVLVFRLLQVREDLLQVNTISIRAFLLIL